LKLFGERVVCVQSGKHCRRYQTSGVDITLEVETDDNAAFPVFKSAR